MDEVLIHKDHLEQIDFTTNHLRLGLNVKDTKEHWSQLAPQDWAELAAALSLSGPRSTILQNVRDFALAAARWGLAHPEELEP